jgi:hypothetical protein
MQSSGSSIRNIQISNAQNAITNSFFDSPSYYQVNTYTPATPLSSTPLDVWITDDSDTKDQKNIIAYPGQDLTKGYLIFWKGSYWLIVQADEDFGDIYSRGAMLECFNSLKWLDADGTTIRETNFCYKTDAASNFGISNDKILILPNERRTIIVQANQYTSLFRKDKRFIFDNRGWKITTIDGVIDGLITIVLTEDDINTAKDNTTLRIADYYDNVNDYEINVTNTITSLEQGSTYQILAKVYNHGVELTSATPTFLSSDASILSVNSSGLVTGVGVGNANITISYGGVDKVLPIAVTSSSVSNKYIVFDTSAYLYTNQSKTFEVHYENNGVTIVDTSTFEVFASDGVSNTNLVSITSQNAADNSCVLKASGNVGTFVLKATNNDDTIVDSLSVEIRSVL